jgi:branched-chain amino acid aminotransferase/4-amino-4-deoxychorismate lyase
VSGVLADDRGFTLGDGLFETVLADAGRLVLWPEHMARLAHGSAALALPAPAPQACEAAAQAALAEAGLGAMRAAVRLTWTAGSGGRGLDRPTALTPRLIATAAPAPRAAAPARLATVAVRRNEGSPASRLKTLAYLDNVIARETARATGADEAVMLNNRGELACAAAANLFWVEGGTLFTPSLDCGVLGGLMRAALIARAPAAGLQVREVGAPAGALASADALVITNSLIGVRPVAALDGAPCADKGGWAARLSELVRDLA